MYVAVYAHICILSNISVYLYFMFVLLFVCISEALQRSQSSLLLEVNQFLQYVKDKFSEVLLPVESITKQGLLGKGYKEAVYNYNINYFSGCYNLNKLIF